MKRNKIGNVVLMSALKTNDRHQRMTGEESQCQHATHRHSAAWLCSLAVRQFGERGPTSRAVFCHQTGGAYGFSSVPVPLAVGSGGINEGGCRTWAKPIQNRQQPMMVASRAVMSE